MSENNGEASEKGLGAFLEAVGILDVIFGGLILYAVYVPYRSEVAQVFPSTGQTAIDVALLVCAAAFIGKPLYLLITFVMAIAMMLIGKMDTFQYPATVQAQLDKYRTGHDGTSPMGETFQARISAAEELLYVVAPLSAIRLEKIRVEARIGYSIAVVIVLYIISWSASLKWSLIGLGIIVAILCGSLAFLQQLNFVQTLGKILESKNLKT